MKTERLEICRLSVFYDISKNVLLFLFFISGVVLGDNPYQVSICAFGVLMVITYLMNVADFLYLSSTSDKEHPAPNWRKPLGVFLNHASYFVFVAGVFSYLTFFLKWVN